MLPMLILENIANRAIMQELVESVSDKFFEKAPNNDSLESYQINATVDNFINLTKKINNNIIYFYQKNILSYTGTSVLKYSNGKFIGRHKDWEPSDPFVIQNNKPKVDLASVCYLNDDYDGGEISFFESFESDNPYITIKPKAGMCIFFDSSIYHETHPIVSGIKYSYTIFYELGDLFASV